MEDYRKKIKQRILLYSILDLIFVGLLIYDQFGANSELKNNNVFNFQCGLATAGVILIFAKIMHYRIILKNEAKIKMNYNKENDERTKAIQAKAGMPMSLFLSILMILSGMIAGYINETVFVTLIAAALLQMVICGVVKLYYMKKM